MTSSKSVVSGSNPPVNELRGLQKSWSSLKNVRTWHIQVVQHLYFELQKFLMLLTGLCEKLRLINCRIFCIFFQMDLRFHLLLTVSKNLSLGILESFVTRPVFFSKNSHFVFFCRALNFLSLEHETLVKVFVAVSFQNHSDETSLRKRFCASVIFPFLLQAILVWSIDGVVE